uniref:Uncharacterized protein n=1 Tax=Sarcophilus harrisii TaxID=9305 RepID=A0A7N4Q175_SARHA
MGTARAPPPPAPVLWAGLGGAGEAKGPLPVGGAPTASVGDPNVGTLRPNPTAPLPAHPGATWLPLPGWAMDGGRHLWNGPSPRNIAKVVSQVHAFQENPYPFAADHKLQSYLRQRIARFSGADISLLAADSRANFHQVPGEKHSRKIQDTLRRMKATFQ